MTDIYNVLEEAMQVQPTGLDNHMFHGAWKRFHSVKNGLVFPRAAHLVLPAFRSAMIVSQEDTFTS